MVERQSNLPPRRGPRPANGGRREARSRYQRTILDIALELFSAQGDAGTSIADIAGNPGTTPAALYYHFRSKSDILETLLAEPIAAYTRLRELASGGLPARELLGSYLDMTINSRELLALVSADAGIRALLDERLPVKPADMIEGIIATLADSGPDRRALIRAHAASAVIKEGASACLSLSGSVTPEDRTDSSTPRCACCPRALTRAGRWHGQRPSPCHRWNACVAAKPCTATHDQRSS